MKKKILFIFFAFNIFIMIGCNNSDKNKPQIYCDDLEDSKIGSTINLNSITAYDDVDGRIDPLIEVISPSKNKVELDDKTFVITEKGKYTITIKAVDKAGNESIKEIELLSIASKPKIIVDDYSQIIYQGIECTLPSITVEDEMDGDLSPVCTLIDPKGENTIILNSFTPQLVGEYKVKITAENSSNIVSEKIITFNSFYHEKEIDSVDGKISSNEYLGTFVKFGGSRGNSIGKLNIERMNNGIKFGIDLSSEKMISTNEKIELYLDKTGTNDTINNQTYKIELSPDGNYALMQGSNTSSDFTELINNELEYSKQVVVKTFLFSGTTLNAGNSDDCGWTGEIFIPYDLLNINEESDVYFSLGYFPESDNYQFDGINYCSMYPDVNKPYKYLNLTKESLILNSSRRYSSNVSKVNGDINKDIYYFDNSNNINVGGLRKLEGANVKLYRDDEGLYFAIDVKDDKKVNSSDRIELFFNIGDPDDSLNSRKNFQLLIHASGFVKVCHGNGYLEFEPTLNVSPQVIVLLNEGTTLDDNTDVDNGYRMEVFIPYSFFEKYSLEEVVSKSTNVGITFGIWRSSSELNEIIRWDQDPTKDWDGWSFGQFADPLYPKTYALILEDSSLISQDNVINPMPEPSDKNIDGLLTEEYWNSDKTANLCIDYKEDLAGLNIKIYRDDKGIRLAFLGDDKQITKKDIIMLYISTKDSFYEIGNEPNKYRVYGKYPNCYDYQFRIGLDNTLLVNRGEYKDWAEEINDLSKISLKVNRVVSDYSYIVEMYIPYSFFEFDNFKLEGTETFGYSVRLAGENKKGSVVLNNLWYAGIYCDSDSPSSYVRIDYKGNIFAATKNNSEIRIDGKYIEEQYSNSCATIISQNNSEAQIYRSDIGLLIKGKLCEEKMRFVFETIEHNLEGPYVYDYQIIVGKDKTIQSSFGNSKSFYSPNLYVSYQAPRAIFSEEKGILSFELLIPYEYLSRYNTTGNYTNIGYMCITSQSNLKLAFDTIQNGEVMSTFQYNGETINEVQCEKPSTYISLMLREK